MKHRWLAWVLAWVLACLPVPPSQATSIDRVPLPPGARAELVSQAVVQNGRTLTIATFTSAASVDGTLAWYAERWPTRDDHPGHVFRDAGGWRIVSRVQGGANVVLQLRATPDGGSEGLLSVMPLDDAPIPLTRPPMPPGASLLSDTRAHDGSRESQVWLLRAPGRAGEVAAFYDDAMRRDGWSSLAAAATPSAGSPSVKRFARRGASADVVVADLADGRAFIVMTTVSGAR